MPIKRAYYRDNEYTPKHITVDLNGQITARAGANLSARQVLDVVNEKGEKVRGFFTPHEFVNAKNLFYSRTSDIPESALRPELSEIRRKIVESKEELADFFDDARGRINKSKEEIRKKDFHLSMLSDQELDDFGSFIKEKFKLDDTVIGTLSKDMAAVNYLTSVMRESANALARERHAENMALQSGDTNINRRNTAMYDYAELLKSNEVLAKSVPMTLVDGEKQINGSFMVNAVGYCLDDLSPSLPGFKGKTMEISGTAAMEISKLQVLDYLCANIDRHLGNMFYKVDTTDPEKVRIIGVQGIDNDDSFGKYTKDLVNTDNIIDRMSGVKDIKVMDAAMAQEILDLTPEALGAKIRLAGLSVAETAAANERLALLQERISKGKIELIKGSTEWEKYASTDKFYSLMTIDEAGGKNIFRNVGHIADAYNHYIEKHPDAVKGPWDDGKGSTVRGRVPTANVLSVEENYSLKDHAARLGEYKIYFKPKKGYEIPEGLEEFHAQYKKTTELLAEMDKKLSAPENGTLMLSDMQRNSIAESLNDLKRTADAYAAKYKNAAASQKVAYITAHVAKNISAYADFARDSIQRDAIEAEKNIASMEAEKIQVQNGLADAFKPFERPAGHSGVTPFTYKGLAAGIAEIEGRSTEYFKSMINAFRKIGDPAKGKNTVEKQVMYNHLITEAQKYLEHKAPDGRTDKLNAKEKKRVQFAKNLIDFAKAGLEKTKKEAEKKAEKSREKEDYLRISRFHVKCDILAENYKNASSPEEKERFAKEILAAKNMFAMGYRNIMDTSSRYPAGHDMQAACGVMLAGGGIKEFMKVYFECANAAQPGNKSDIFDMLGIEKSYRDASGQLEQIGVKVLSDMNAPAAAQANDAPQAVEEKEEIAVPELSE